MRLIDGKELAADVLGEIFERGQASGLWEEQLEIGAITYRDIEFANGYDRALDDVYRIINDMPTVKAIPIDFIKAFSEILLDRRERFVLETLIEVWEGKREIKVPYINQMLKDWEKENATEVND